MVPPHAASSALGVATHMLPPEEEEEERLPVVPLGDRKLRACLVTGLVKTEDQARRPSAALAQREPTHKRGLSTQRMMAVAARRQR